jgi:hypothetical protein
MAQPPPRWLVLDGSEHGSTLNSAGTAEVFDAARRALLLFGMDTAALPGWDEEDEAEQSEGRPCRCSYGRRKQRSDLTSSFVPRGTSPARGGGNQFLRFSV